MFNFFRSNHTRRNRRSLDLYELNERETDQLMGGSPVRHLIEAQSQSSPWMRSTTPGFSGATYQPVAMTPLPPMRQQTPGWVHVGEEHSMNRFYTHPNE